MTTDRLWALEARDSIRRLISLYSDAVGRRDADALAPLFAEDARVQIAHLPVREGRHAAVEGFRRTASAFQFLHQKCDTGLIDVTGESARASHGVLELNIANGASELNLIFGTYQDEYRFTNERWRFFRRHFLLQSQLLLPTAETHYFVSAAPMQFSL